MFTISSLRLQTIAEFPIKYPILIAGCGALITTAVTSDPIIGLIAGAAIYLVGKIFSLIYTYNRSSSTKQELQKRQVTQFSPPIGSSSAEVKYLKAHGKTMNIQCFDNRYGVVPFYDEKMNPHTAVFGNFHPVKIVYEGIEYTNAEAAFQAQKATTIEDKKRFSKLSGHDAWKLAQNEFNHRLPKNWHEDLKDQKMKEILTVKFQDKALQKLLLTTKGLLVEHIPQNKSHVDTWWGDGQVGNGKNKLGTILMEIRRALGGVGVIDYLSEDDDDPNMSILLSYHERVRHVW